MHEIPRQLDNAGLTRISVRSTRDYYLVRSGAGPAVKVMRRGTRLECECGERDCVHVLSLRLCGFVEPGSGTGSSDMPMAA